MPKSEKPYKLSDDKLLTANQLSKLSYNNKLIVMSHWFYANFEDPVHSCPYQSSEGGYQYIWGGPYDAREELHNEFGGIVSDRCIDELADELESHSLQWSGKDDGSGYWDDYIDIVESLNTKKEFTESINNLEELLKVSVPKKMQNVFIRLLYANVISILETYLSDTFIKLVTGKGEFFYKYFIYTKEKKYKVKTILLSEIYSQKKQLDKDNIRFLTSGFNWHNLEKAEEIYENVITVSFIKFKELFMEAVKNRHNIIHRNGKNDKGEYLTFSKNEIKKIIKNSKIFIDYLHDEIGKKVFDRDATTSKCDWIINDSPY